MPHLAGGYLWAQFGETFNDYTIARFQRQLSTSRRSDLCDAVALFSSLVKPAFTPLLATKLPPQAWQPADHTGASGRPRDTRLAEFRGILGDHARKLATQARPSNESTPPHYQHSEIGYNYRLSNVLAGIGRGQIRVLEERAQRRVPIGREARRRNFDYYQETLGHLPGIAFRAQWAPALGREAPWGRHTRWLTCLTINPDEFGATREDLRLALEAENIEARPVWKPMHCGGPLGAIFAAPRGPPEAVGGQVAEALFADGLCLPSGSNLTDGELARVVGVVQRLWQRV